LLKAQTVTLIHSHRFDAKSGIGQWARTVNADAADNTPALKALWNVAPDWLATLPLQQTIEGDAAEPDVTRLQLTSASDPKLAVGLRYGWRNWLALLDAHRPSKTAPAAPCSDAQAVAMLKAFTEFCVLCAVREGPLGVVQLNAQVEHALGLGQSPWYAGRPVMVTRNDYALELMNGDIGLCLPGPDGMLRVAFPAVDGGVRWVMPSRHDGAQITGLGVHACAAGDTRTRVARAHTRAGVHRPHPCASTLNHVGPAAGRAVEWLCATRVAQWWFGRLNNSFSRTWQVVPQTCSQ
jgi:exodeoxyribonuclease V alpha subunit